MIADIILPWIGILAVFICVVFGLDRACRGSARITMPVISVPLLLVGFATGSLRQGMISVVLICSGLALLAVGLFRCLKQNSTTPLFPRVTGARRQVFVIVIVLYAVTWIGGWTMVRSDRPSQAPVVVPVIPFVVFASDTKGAVGELTLYLWHVSGVQQLAGTLRWIA